MRPVTGAVPSEVDTVIVGAGAAGCVLAARLSQYPDNSVLLLEAGTTTGLEPEATMPGAALGQRFGDAAWPDVTVRQPSLGGRRIALAQGKGLGGGSSINMMAWLHGHPADYDSWHQGGAAGWGYADVAPYLTALGESMKISGPRDVSALPMNFLAAGVELGLPLTEDFNGSQRDGIGLVRGNIDDGRRHSVVSAYLVPALARANLTVRTGLQVTSILFDGDRAVGVTVSGSQGEQQIRARRAVVLAAGALRTPQLLMLSGIGPAEHLREHGIEARHDLAGVGRNLQDHPTITPTWPVRDGSFLLNALRPADERAYRLLRRGPLASLHQAGALLRGNNDLLAPDLQFTLALLGLTPERAVLGEPAATCAISLLTPASRGTVTLASADPHAAPVADPAFLTAPSDRERLRAGLRLARDLFATEPLATATGAPLSPSNWTYDGLDRWITANAGTAWNPCGTCALGVGPDAVTDPATMRVHGLDGLFVADSSVLPTVTRGNIQAPVLMIAERAAERIATATGYAGQNRTRAARRVLRAAEERGRVPSPRTS